MMTMKLQMKVKLMMTKVNSLCRMLRQGREQAYEKSATTSISSKFYVWDE